MLATVADCLASAWAWPDGDRSAVAWAITLGYAAAAVLAFRAGRRRGDGRERLFWTGTGLMLAFLAANKQLDLQTWVTATGRCMARAEGWFDARRGVQALFVEGLGLGLLALLALLLFWMRRTLRRNWLALAGLAVLAGFIVMRAGSFHHLDQLLAAEVLEMKLHRWAEIAGLCLVIAGALLPPRRR